MRVFWDKPYCLDLPAGHRFPMEKYSLIPQQLLHEGIIEASQLIAPTPCTWEDAALCHKSEYLTKLQSLTLSKSEQRRSGFPLSQALIDRELLIVGGTMQAVEYAMQNGIAFNVAGGTHHAYSDRAEGFCLLNDIAISSISAINNGDIKKVLVVDLDVHQGNGTAEIFRDNRNVYTFSMHGAHNYPLKKESSDLDLPMPDNCDDDHYLQSLKDVLPKLISKTSPDLIHYQCGVDVLASDKLGRLSLSMDACKERDRLVLSTTHAQGIPTVCTMGGGYSPDIKTIVNAHVETYRIAANLYI